MFLLSFLKTNFFYVFTEIWIPKPEFGSGFSHSVVRRQRYKTVIIKQFTDIVYIYIYTCM